METLQKPLSDEELKQLGYFFIDNVSDEAIFDKWLVAYEEIIRLRLVEDRYLAIKENIMRGVNA